MMGKASMSAIDERTATYRSPAFHRAVAYATHNPTLARYIIALQNIATRFWIYAMERETPDEQIADVTKHRALGHAIAAGDEAAAEAAMMAVVGEPPSAYSPTRRSQALGGGRSS